MSNTEAEKSCETVTIGGEVFDVVGDGLIKGQYGHRYYDALYREQKKHKDDLCPENLCETRILGYKGFTCRVYYNYVPPYGFGVTPMNVWWGYISGEIDDKKYHVAYPLKEDVKTIDEAVKIIESVFKLTVERTIKRNKSCSVN